MLSNRTMPPCVVIPELVYEDVQEAARWLCDAFGFTPRWIAGGHRAQLSYGADGAIALTEARVGWRSDDEVVLRVPRSDEVSQAVLLRVEDVDSHHERALAHGARVLHPPSDFPYGERQYAALDPAGHRWTFTQSIADLMPEEWGGTTVDLG
jgi:uncharacterized glyoxalase superfamily protein PhnB